MPTRRPREPFNALVLAALAVVVTAVLIAAGGGGSHRPAPTGDPSWQGLAGAGGADVLVGDPGRAYLPLDRLPVVATYQIPTVDDLEDSPVKQTTVRCLYADADRGRPQG